MPTVLLVRGWRLFFYANEGQEPIHIHARKGAAECKYWLRVDEFEILEAEAYNLTPRLRREIRSIIFAHFDLIVEEWNRVHGERPE
jgi:hypothetical protein